MTDVLCIGQLLMEFVADTTDVSLSGSPGFTKAPGGDPANVDFARSRLGVKSGFMGKVGDDFLFQWSFQSIRERLYW